MTIPKSILKNTARDHHLKPYLEENLDPTIGAAKGRVNFEATGQHQQSIEVVLSCDTDRSGSSEEEAQRQEKLKAQRFRVLQKFLKADWDTLSESQSL
jgi:hypothetical protein